MRHLLTSFYYKLVRDLTFRITAIIGVALAVLMSLGYGLFIKGVMGSGAYMLATAISPVQNFGIAIPVNLVIFTTLLFSQGIIRNQVIVGNSKTKVYFSLLIGGITFTLALLIIYVGLCIGITSIIGGFIPTVNDTVLTNYMSGEVVVKLLVITFLSYLTISTYSVFIATTLRSSGPCIPLAIVPMIMLGVFSLLLNTLGTIEGIGIPDWLMMLNRIVNPFNIVGSMSITAAGSQITILQDDFVFNIINNVVYSVCFALFGVIVFNKKDIK